MYMVLNAIEERRGANVCLINSSLEGLIYRL